MAYHLFALFRLVLGTLYPAYASYKAVRTKNVREYVKWMMYWIVFAAFSLFETFADIFVAFWFPFYYEVKILLLIWLISPVSRGSLGSSIIYRKFVHPALMKREDEIDHMMLRMQEQGYHTLAQFGGRAFTYVSNFVMQTAIKAPTFLAQLAAKEAEARNLQQRVAVGWEPSNRQPNVQDAVDGDVDMDGLQTFDEASNPSPVVNFDRNIVHPENCQGPNRVGDEGVLGIMEQVELDEVTESEIDSPERQIQNQEIKRKRGKTKVKASIKSQDSKSRQTKNDNKEASRLQELPPNVAASIFDFSSDDDTEMAPEFGYDDISDGLDMDDRIDQDPMKVSKPKANEAFIASRGDNTRKGTKKQSKISGTSSLNAPTRKGSRKRVPRAQL